MSHHVLLAEILIAVTCFVAGWILADIWRGL